MTETADIPIQAIVGKLRELTVPLRAQGVKRLYLFGSRARGDARPDSDLDVLVSFSEAPSLFRLIEMENYLSDRLGVRVDLVLREALKPRIGQRVLHEVVPV